MPLIGINKFELSLSKEGIWLNLIKRSSAVGLSDILLALIC